VGRIRGQAQRAASGKRAVRIDNDDIGGVVTGPGGPEAGVWVIAETSDLPPSFLELWSRTTRAGSGARPSQGQVQGVGARYDLVDSPRVDGEPGKQLNLRAVPAPNAAAAGAILSGDLLVLDAQIPEADQFGGKSNIPANIAQSDWLTVVKNRSCVGCHQLGQLSTRTIPAALGQFESSEKAWIRRVQSGQARR